MANIKQGRDETLKLYLKQFNEAATHAEIVPLGETLMALVAGGRPEMRLWRNIRKHQCHDIEDFYQGQKHT